MIEQTQLEFLQAAKAELDVTWDELAALAGIAPRALKTYRMPAASAEYRGMPKLARNAIVAVLEKYTKKRNANAGRSTHCVP